MWRPAPCNPVPHGAAPVLLRKGLLGRGSWSPQRQLASHFLWAHVVFSHSTFEEEQKLRKQEIINRILKEEAEEEKRKKKQSSPAPAMGQAPLREKTWSYITDICEGRDAVALPSFPGVSKCPIKYSQHQGKQTGNAPRDPVGTSAEIQQRPPSLSLGNQDGLMTTGQCLLPPWCQTCSGPLESSVFPLVHSPILSCN